MHCGNSCVVRSAYTFLECGDANAKAGLLLHYYRQSIIIIIFFLFLFLHLQHWLQRIAPHCSASERRKPTNRPPTTCQCLLGREELLKVETCTSILCLLFFLHFLVHFTFFSKKLFTFRFSLQNGHSRQWTFFSFSGGSSLPPPPPPPQFITWHCRCHRRCRFHWKVTYLFWRVNVSKSMIELLLQVTFTSLHTWAELNWAECCCWCWCPPLSREVVYYAAPFFLYVKCCWVLLLNLFYYYYYYYCYFSLLYFFTLYYQCATWLIILHFLRNLFNLIFLALHLSSNTKCILLLL